MSVGAYLADDEFTLSAVGSTDVDVLEDDAGQSLLVCLASLLEAIERQCAWYLGFDRVDKLLRSGIAQLEEVLRLVKVEQSDLSLQVEVHQYAIRVG